MFLGDLAMDRTLPFPGPSGRQLLLKGKTKFIPKYDFSRKDIGTMCAEPPRLFLCLANLIPTMPQPIPFPVRSLAARALAGRNPTSATSAKVIGMIRGLKFLSDQLANPCQGPTVGWKSVRQGATIQHLLQLLLLGRAEFRLASCDLPFSKAFGRALGFHGLRPITDRRWPPPPAAEKFRLGTVRPLSTGVRLPGAFLPSDHELSRMASMSCALL